MKRFVIAVIIVILAGVGYYLLSPLFIERPVNERIEDLMKGKETATTLATGQFVGLKGHSATGTARLIEINGMTYLRFDDDFRVTNGPDVYVYFGKDGAYRKDAQIAALKGNSGGQNYEIPADITPGDYNEVWVWCRAFSVPFGMAVLK